MANNWTEGEYDSLNLENYSGPYNRAALLQSRMELQYHVGRMQDTAVWWKIRKKTPVSVNGETYMYDHSQGFGEASTMFSHAELPENKNYEEPNLHLYEQDFETSEGPSYRKSVSSEKSNISATVQSGDIESLDTTDIEIVPNESNTSVVIVNEDSNDSNDSCEVTREEIDMTGSKKRKYSEVDNDLQIDLKDTDNNTQHVIVIDDEPVLTDNAPQNVDNEGNIVIEPDKVHGKTELGKVYLKCDLCDFKCHARKEMSNHLNTALHFTASEYADQGNDVIIVKRLVMFNFDAKFKNVFVICPHSGCKKVFPHIYICAQHYKSKHSTTGDYEYGLLRVVKDVDLTVNKNDQRCNICSAVCNSPSDFMEHLEQSGHYTLDNCEQLYFCKYCNTRFDTATHITNHLNEAHKGEGFSFKVIHFKEIERHVLKIQEATSSSPKASIKRKRVGGREVAEDGQSLKVTVSSEKLTDQSHGSSGRLTESSNTDPLFFIDRSGGDATGENQIQSNSQPENCSIINSSVMISDKGDAPGSSSNSSKQLTKKYKCDFCPHMTADHSMMYKHLQDCVHHAASKVVVDAKDAVIHLIEPTSVIYEGAKYKKVIAACPEPGCQLLFKSIYMCSHHMTRCHKSEEMAYGLVQVIDHEPCKVPVKHSSTICLTCGEQFTSNKKLSIHKSQSGHDLFKTRVDCRSYTLCPYCHNIYPSFNSAWNHIEKHTYFAKDGKLDLILLQVSTEIKKFAMYAYEDNEFARSLIIKNKISDLMSMKKQCGKGGRKKLRYEIRRLRALLPKGI